MTKAASLFVLAALIGCQGDESISAYAAETYQLMQINGAPFAASATLTLATPGEISGQAPCNSYGASQSAPYPWLDIGAVRSTRRACPDLDAEARYLTMLPGMTIAEAVGGTLILTNETGDEMVFQAIP